jgi:nucleoside-diphosphate-sugar epimerase
VGADLSGELPPTVFAGVTTIVHCAAETAGGKEAHERNTITATRHLLEAAAVAGVRRFVHISSIAVLKPDGLVNERTQVDLDNPARGPYVWAKAVSEREVLDTAPRLGLDVRVIRPGPLVDFEDYEPPGRLGRELGPIYVAVGPKAGRMSLCGVRSAAQVIRAVVEDFTSSPSIMNLVEPDAPTRAELLNLWLAKRPDLRAVWLPAWFLAVLSPVAKLAQRALRPRSTPLDIAAAFGSPRYDTTLAGEALKRARSSARLSPVPQTASR